MPEPPGDITVLLNRWSEGSREAENELFALVLPNLRGLARHFMRKERPDHSLQATELVNTIYFRMVAAKKRDWQNRKHFFAIAARAMRRYLIDHARGRPPAGLLPLDEFERFLPAHPGKLDLAITVDRLLDELAKSQPDWCMLVEMKYFLGLTDDEAAEAMNLKVRTMQRMWCDSRQWLFARMESANVQNAG
jgi:RNA polymerase sigma-70 factor (ECF subfamily)